MDTNQKKQGKWPTSIVELSQMSPKEIGELRPVTEAQAASFFKEEQWTHLNTLQVAALALSQKRKMMPDTVVDMAVNRHLEKTHGDNLDAFTVMMASPQDRAALKSAALISAVAPIAVPRDAPRLDHSDKGAAWPRFEALSAMNGREISQLKPLTHEQAIAFIKEKAWRHLDTKQVAALALTQGRRILPDSVATHSVNQQLGLDGKDKLMIGDIALSSPEQRGKILSQLSGSMIPGDKNLTGATLFNSLFSNLLPVKPARCANNLSI